MKYIKYLVLFLTIIILLTIESLTNAADQSSTNYSIPVDVIDSSGGDVSSTNYDLLHSTGQTSAIGDSSSTNYNNYSGYLNALSGVCESPVIESISVDGCLSELCFSDVDVIATDTCGEDLSYTWTPLNGGSIIGSGSSVQFDPPDAGPHPCPYQVELKVISDASGLETTQLVDIYIKLAGDVNGDGTVDFIDKALIKQHYGETENSPDWDYRADVSCNGVVDLMDKIKVRQQRGQTGGCICQ